MLKILFRFQSLDDHKIKNAFVNAFFGATQGIRTPDLSFRRRTLYPAELASHKFEFYFS